MAYSPSALRLNVVDQNIMVTNQISLTSGQVEANTVVFTFNSAWDDYTPRMAVFYNSREPDKVSRRLLTDNGSCTIPPDILQKSGKLMIGVLGIWSNETFDDPFSGEKRVLTSEVVAYDIKTGAVTRSSWYDDGQYNTWVDELERINRLKDLVTQAQDANNTFQSTQTKNYDTFTSQQNTNYTNFTNSVNTNYTNYTKTMNDTLASVYTGGENLVVNGEFVSKGNFVRIIELDLDLFKTLQGKTVTISCDAKADTASEYIIDCYFRRTDDEGSAFLPTLAKQTITNTYQRYSWTTTVPNLVTSTGSPITKLYFYIRGGTNTDMSNSGKGDFLTKRVKIERGPVATPWCLAESEEFIRFNDYKTLNGVSVPVESGGANTNYFRILNFEKYQIIILDTWLGNVNISTSWTQKEILSIPTKYIRFSNWSVYSWGAPEYFDSGTGPISLSNFDVNTGIVKIVNRVPSITNTQLFEAILLY